MPNSITIPNTFVDDTDALAADVNANFSAVATFLNSTKLNDDNLKTGGVGTASIADAGVTTAKIADANVTTAKLADAAVTTAKLNDGAVTQAKRAALGQQLSSACTSWDTTSTSFGDVTNLSVSITTTGRPVLLALVQSDTSSTAYVSGENVSSAQTHAYSGEWQILRGASVVARQTVGASYGNVTDGSKSRLLGSFIPLSAISAYDTGAVAGTYTYKLQFKATSGAEINVVNVKLMAFEL
jgi:hypothetical protein